MGAQNSNLSASNFKYDLVAALSQDTLNANLKELLASMADTEKPITAFYKFVNPIGDSGETIQMSEVEVNEITGGQDIFDIPNGTTSQDPATYLALGDALASAGFAYAFQVGFGLPSGVPLSQLQDIITLSANNPGQDNDQTVIYDMYFGSFELMKLSCGYNSWSIQQLSQPNDNPWVFQWMVDLNLQQPCSVPFNELPIQVQNNLNAVDNLNTTTLFSLQQLLLDLNTPELITGLAPTVLGIDPTDPLYGDLNAFVQIYWSALIKNGGITFATSVTPGDDYPTSSIVPTALDFVVSSYSDPSKKGLSTLNYLVMTGSNPLPNPIAPFSWDWCDGDQVPGVMSIRRDVFLDFLNKALSPALSPVCQTVDVNLDTDNPYIHINPNSNPQNYGIYLPGGTITVAGAPTSGPQLCFNYNSYKKSTKWDFAVHYSLQAKLEVESFIYPSGHQIICETTVSIYYEYDIEGIASQTKGYALAQKNTTTFNLNSVGVGTTPGNGTAGLLQVILASANNQDLTQTENDDQPYYNGDFDPSIFAKVFSDGEIQQLNSQVTAIGTSLNSILNNYTVNIESILNGSFGFVFPGAQTFFFSNPAFSDNLDLTVEVSFQSLD